MFIILGLNLMKILSRINASESGNSEGWAGMMQAITQRIASIKGRTHRPTL